MPRSAQTPGAADTKTRILDAAEELFGEHGYAATSLRHVTHAAGVNVAAVNYHFGSKEGLLRAVVRRAMASVNADRARLLDDLEAAAAPPAADELIRAFVAAGADIVRRHGDRGPHVARLLGRVICEPGPGIRRIFATEVAPVEGRYLDALTVALPEFPPSEVAFRYRAMIGLLALYQAGTLADLHPGEETTVAHDRREDPEALVAMLTAAFHAPPGTASPTRSA
ncbi:TetR family transcriptional regulator [Streptomyces sp. B6B3]|uniref:TetR/AcrR family transcriptional regulator n=1 Tax=Streptomyces sp. B6B3 TaxID=3153570 RepID=UPI00325C47D7